ncbi:hypothetical protein TNCV_1427161 [Trichonephila clavipes]|nr:hypothetical protein TNCV_1427161 [Trichonephila clavipes]
METKMRSTILHLSTTTISPLNHRDSSRIYHTKNYRDAMQRALEQRPVQFIIVKNQPCPIRTSEDANCVRDRKTRNVRRFTQKQN